MDELLKEVRNINAIISEVYLKLKNNHNGGKDADAVSERGIIHCDDALLDKLGSFKFLKVNGIYLLKPLTETNREHSQSGYSLSLSDFIGIDNVIKEVFRNTMKFASGKPANNVLLWGDRGTGKSSLIRAIARSFGEPPYIDKIKFIEVVEDTAEMIYELITILESKPSRFILIFDDIAYDADSMFYKKLKSMLDGGLDELPENIIIYATSNKRHLTAEKFRKENLNSTEFIHPEEEAEESLSLSDRFGLSYGLYSFSQETFLKIVELYIKKYGIKISSLNMDEVRKNALAFASIKGSRSGRTAKQYVINMIKD
jgi:predicted AAA+ superfamily ATPase